jgi:uncharacterized protein YbaR (Trm112 family)
MPHIACPDCSNPLKIRPDEIGDTVTCPACGRRFMVSDPAASPVVPQIVLEPADDEYEDDEEEDEPSSPSLVVVEPVSRPGSKLPSIVLFVAGSFVFLAILIGLSISSRHALDPDYAPVDVDEGELSYLDGIAEAQYARELAARSEPRTNVWEASCRFGIGHGDRVRNSHSWIRFTTIGRFPLEPGGVLGNRTSRGCPSRTIGHSLIPRSWVRLINSMGGGRSGYTDMRRGVCLWRQARLFLLRALLTWVTQC